MEFYCSQQFRSEVYQRRTQTRCHVLAEEAFASNTSCDPLFSGVQGFISSIMDSTGHLSSVCSDVVSNARRMPLLRECQ